MVSSTIFCASLLSFVSLSCQQSCGAAYAQCGGTSWTGASCCTAGYTCSTQNAYYAQCVPSTNTGSTASTTASKPVSSTTTTTHTSGGASAYTTTDTSTVASHSQSAYPSTDASSCGSWALVDNVCCPAYCSNDDESSDCSGCSGTSLCVSPPSADCKSGTMYSEVLSVTDDEDWHYSRSTHFGLTSGGACGFGLYGLCTKGSADADWIDAELGSTCTAFCTAYPTLCQDPTSVSATLRGNFAAPNGDYYTQFWPNLPGSLDNYLSCGECFELVRTKSDGSDYAVGEDGYTAPIYLEIVDSCPCDANPKWCCGPGADHCGEIDFTYGCPLPENSIHLDLSDIAMGRLQGNGSLTDGVIPTRYKRVPCPKPGNVYIWLRDGGGAYYFALSAVNTNGVGSVVNIEVKSSDSDVWYSLERDPNYTSSRPQERYGAWVLPSGLSAFNLPIGVRLTAPDGQQIVNEDAITSFTAPSTAPSGYNYIDLGVQFTS